MKMKADGVVYYCEMPKQYAKKESELARQMLKQGFSDFFHMDFHEGLLRRKEYGKPYYEGKEHLFFNISHCRDGVAVALSNLPVGVDVESMRKINERTVKKCCSREERIYVYGGQECVWDSSGILSETETKRFLMLWTLKESYVKMTGEGLRTPFDQVCFPLEDSQKIWDEAVQEVKGFDSASRHFLYSTGQVLIALTVQCAGRLENPDIAWQKYQF